MKVTLISLPWSMSSQPSAALGALAAFIRREEPSWEVACKYEYVRLGARLGYRLYDGLAMYKHDLGELLYTPLLYPEKDADVCAQFETWAKENLAGVSLEVFGANVKTFADLYKNIQWCLKKHIDALVQEVAGQDVVGLTSCFGQLFSNLAFAARLEKVSPRTRVVLGGSTVSARVGPSVLREYPQVDYVVQGEGELPFLALLRAVSSAAGEEPPAVELDAIKGLVHRGNVERLSDGAALWEVPSMDALPLPDYAEYVELAKQNQLVWHLPVEGSRGCWWDRTKRHDNPKSTCYFCNLNVQWGGYREKSTARVVAEVEALVDRYSNSTIYFLDNIIRHEGVAELGRSLAALEKDLFIFYEMRANIRPHELLVLWEAGLREAQIGVEGLSSSYLKRFGKGTTTIQNLLTMKVCKELGIKHGANLIVNFPGSTEAEVEETVRTIRDHAIAYEPCHISRFNLSLDGTVDKLRGEFGVTNVRNHDSFRAGLPEDVWRRLHLFDLSFDNACADWSRVFEAVEEWKKVHTKEEPLLVYQDGGTFLRITDRRGAQPRTPVLRAAAREIYLHCTEVRSLERIFSRFTNGTDHQKKQISSFLDRMVKERLMFQEQGKYLSLAPAATPRAAARRIRAMHAAEEAENAANRTRRLPIAAPSPAG